MIETATILIADDNPDDLELLKRALRKAGISNPVQHLSDGKQVIDYFSSDCDRAWPLLLLLDLKMPRYTGLVALEWLRQQPQLRHLPTIVFSNSDREQDVQECFRRGAHGYWVKPSRFEDLVRMMVRLRELVARVVVKLDLPCPPLTAAA
jgi:CheY-like chemotaxis protein